jgi:hypothetical protein
VVFDDERAFRTLGLFDVELVSDGLEVQRGDASERGLAAHRGHRAIDELTGIVRGAGRSDRSGQKAEECCSEHVRLDAAAVLKMARCSETRLTRSEPLAER